MTRQLNFNLKPQPQSTVLLALMLPDHEVCKYKHERCAAGGTKTYSMELSRTRCDDSKMEPAGFMRTSLQATLSYCTRADFSNAKGEQEQGWTERGVELDGATVYADLNGIPLLRLRSRVTRFRPFQGESRMAVSSDIDLDVCLLLPVTYLHQRKTRPTAQQKMNRSGSSFGESPG